MNSIMRPLPRLAVLVRLAPLAALAVAGALALAPAPASAMDPSVHSATVRVPLSGGRPTSCRSIIAEQDAVRPRGAFFWCGQSSSTARLRATSQGPAASPRRSYRRQTASAHRSHRSATTTTRASRQAAAPAAQPLHLPAATAPSAAWGNGPDVGSMLGLAAKFAIVLVLLFLCLRVLRQIMPRLSGSAGGPGAMVLHSESIGEKQRVQLLDLEVRLVLIAASGGATTVLSTIDDPDEMATLRARYQRGTRSRANAASQPRAADNQPERPAASVAKAVAPDDLASVTPSTTVAVPTRPQRPSFAEALAIATRQALAGGAARPAPATASTMSKASARPARAPKPAATSAAPARTAARVDVQAASLTLGRSLQSLRALRLRAEQL